MTPHDVSEALLIERLCDGDLEALGDLFDKHYAKVYRTALAVTHDAHVAEDITQECFLKLHHYADRIDTSFPLGPWLYRVTVNLSYTWVSRHKKRRVSLESVIDQLMSPIWHRPDQMAESAETQAQIRQAIRELNFHQRVVVVLHYLNGLNLEEIGDILECPVGTVKSRLYYARANLRRKLATDIQPSEVGRARYVDIPSTG